MLCLTEHISRNLHGVAGAVSNDKYLAWSCYHIDIDNAENLLLGFSYKGVTRTYYLVNLGYRFCTVGKGSYRLRSAHLEDTVNSRDLCSTEDYGIYLALCVWRCGHYDLVNSRDLCRECVHKHRRGISRSTAWNVKSRTFNGYYLLTEDNSVLFFDTEAFALLMLVVENDILLCALHDRNKLSINRAPRFFYFLGCNFKTVKVATVKLFCVFLDCPVTVFSYVIYDISNYIADIGG